MDRSHLRLVAITDRRNTPGEWIQGALLALQGGATALMLREKDLPTPDLFHAAQCLRSMADAHGAALLINDRVDIALAVGADAVHLGWTSLPLPVVRRIVSDRCKIGVSAHSLKEAERALQDGADYLTYSPVFPTPSKKGLVPVVGISGLQEAARAFRLPIVALGGIDETNAAECLTAGAAGIAVIRAIFSASDIRMAAQRLAAVVKGIPT